MHGPHPAVATSTQGLMRPKLSCQRYLNQDFFRKWGCRGCLRGCLKNDMNFFTYNVKTKTDAYKAVHMYVKRKNVTAP